MSKLYKDHNFRVWEGEYPFTKAAISTHAPNCSGVYQVLYKSGGIFQVAYIGIATGDTIRGRLTKHRNGTGNRALARLGTVSDFTFVFYRCDAQTARQIESHVVTTRKPPFNVRPEYNDFIANITVH
jgi:excinuclease UvrABC nuclease subunit